MKKSLIGVSVSLMLGAVTAADASILFNPNGTGLGGAINIASFGWTTGNGYTLNGDHSSATTGQKFNDQTLAQARLDSAYNEDGNTVISGITVPQDHLSAVDPGGHHDHQPNCGRVQYRFQRLIEHQLV